MDTPIALAVVATYNPYFTRERFNMKENGLKKAIEAINTGLRIYEGTRKTGMTESQLTMVSGMKAALTIALEELEK